MEKTVLKRKYGIWEGGQADDKQQKQRKQQQHHHHHHHHHNNNNNNKNKNKNKNKNGTTIEATARRVRSSRCWQLSEASAEFSPAQRTEEKEDNAYGVDEAKIRAKGKV